MRAGGEAVLEKRMNHDASPAIARTSRRTSAFSVRGKMRDDVKRTEALPKETSESDNASIAKAKSEADWKRCSAFFSRQRWTTRCRAGGTAGTSCERVVGSSFRIALMVSAGVDLRNARWPVSIS